MAGPWERYQQTEEGPWAKYAKPVSAQPVEQASKPSVFSNIKDMLMQSRGAPIAGGPMAMIYGQGMKAIDEATQKAAYMAGGAVTDALSGNVSPEVAGGAGYATNVGVQAIPMILSGEAAKLLSPAMKAPARSLMQSALKPTLEQLRTGKGARAVETMLKEGYNPTAGGVEKMKGAIASLNDDIAEAIKNSPATVDKRIVAGYLNDALKKFENQVNPSSDVKAIESAWTEFLSHPALAGRNNIPVQLAQEMKKGTYKSLGEKSFGELKGASTEAQKTLARGLKEEISKAVPGVAGMNKRESDLINALKVAERRVLMDANKNPLGLGILNPLMLPLWLWDRSPAAKAMTARALYSGAEQIPATAARLAVTPLLMQSGRAPVLLEE